MLMTQKSYVDAWMIDFSCSEFKPDGWLPGQPLKYAVFATAELQHPAPYSPGWVPVGSLRYPQRDFAAIFDSDREGHEAAIAELTARIKHFKK